MPRPCARSQVGTARCFAEKQRENKVERAKCVTYMWHDVESIFFEFIAILNQYCTIAALLDQYEFPINFSLNVSMRRRIRVRARVRLRVDIFKLSCQV